MTGQEIFNKVTAGDVFLAYVNDSGNAVICRTDDHLEVVRLIVNQGARVIPFESLLTCYNVYKSCDDVNKDGIPFVTFSDWVIGEA